VGSNSGRIYTYKQYTNDIGLVIKSSWVQTAAESIYIATATHMTSDLWSRVRGFKTDLWSRVRGFKQRKDLYTYQQQHKWHRTCDQESVGSKRTCDQEFVGSNSGRIYTRQQRTAV